MTSHSCRALDQVRLMAEGSGGRVLILVAGTSPYYAGLRRAFTDRFFDAAMDFVCHPAYRTIFAVTGIGSHLPPLRIDSSATVGLIPAGWVIREAGEDSQSTVQSSPEEDDDDLPSSSGLMLRHGVVMTSRLRFHGNGVPWAERILAMLGLMEEAAGLDWRIDRHQPGKPSGRGLVIIDEAYLSPDPREDLHQLPTQNQRELIMARLRSLLRQLEQTQADIVVLSTSEARAGLLAHGGFVAAQLEGRPQAEHFPALLWPGEVALWPSRDTERPFGEFWKVPVGRTRPTLYSTLRSVAPKPLPSPLEELDSLVGMDGVRRQIEALEASVRASIRRQRLGLPAASFRLHTALYGPPGTGKTTVARILARVFARLGLLDSGRFIEANREKLVGAYIGHTEQKTAEVCERALGGVLFIDEAYALTPHSENDFGRQAIDTLLTWMENYKDRLAVIFAGYDDEMRRFIDENPGMHSRIQFHVTLREYSDDELVSIAGRVASRDHSVIAPDAFPSVRRRVVQMREECRRLGRAFGNGRAAENLVRAACTERDRRIGTMLATAEDMTLLLARDFDNAQV